jgi:hypothetical protein
MRQKLNLTLPEGMIEEMKIQAVRKELLAKSSRNYAVSILVVRRRRSARQNRLSKYVAPFGPPFKDRSRC